MKRTIDDICRRWIPGPDASETEVRGALVRERAELVTLAKRCRQDEETLRKKWMACVDRIADIDRELNDGEPE